jgi:hypothetical protein
VVQASIQSSPSDIAVSSSALYGGVLLLLFVYDNNCSISHTLLGLYIGKQLGQAQASNTQNQKWDGAHAM